MGDGGQVLVTAFRENARAFSPRVLRTSRSMTADASTTSVTASRRRPRPVLRRPRCPGAGQIIEIVEPLRDRGAACVLAEHPRHIHLQAHALFDGATLNFLDGPPGSKSRINRSALQADSIMIADVVG